MIEPIQTIRSPSGDELVVMPRELYENLVDAKAARDAQAALAVGEEELLTEDEVRKLLASPTAIAFWRRKRGMQQEKLAEALGTSQGYVSDIEIGRRKGTLAFYQGAAHLLRVSLDTIVPEDRPEREPKPVVGRRPVRQSKNQVRKAAT